MSTKYNPVIPAKAGVDHQLLCKLIIKIAFNFLKRLDSRFHGNDDTMFIQ